MGKWKTCTLGELNCYTGSSITPMDTPDTTYELYSVPSWENKYPEIVEGKDIGSTKQSVSKNDVLLCKINPRINRVWVVDQYSQNPLIASSEWIVIRNKQLFSKYLYYYLQSPQFRDMLISEQAGIGGSLTRAQPKRVATYPVLIPPLDVQQKIADVLDKASALIELRRAQLDKLDLLVKSQFIEMFGDPEANEKGWPILSLKDLFSIRSSKRIYQNEQTSQGVPFLRVADLVQKIDGNAVACNLYISNEQYNDFIQGGLVPKPRDILVTTRGTLGKCYIIQPDDRFYFQDGMISWLEKTNVEIESVYISNLFEMDSLRRQVADVSKGATVDFLSLDKLGKLKIMYPDFSLQQQFADFVQQVDKSKFAIQQSLSKLELNYKSLMQKCFRGELF